MTAPIKRKFSRSLFINAACLVLATTGLALISNRLLDKLGIADEAPLSVSERAEKAHRNQAEYKGEPVEVTKVGWFSSDKFDCENQQVIEAFKNKMACEALVQCEQFGFRSLNEVASASASNIDRKVEDHRIQNEAKMRAPMSNPSDAELAWVAKQTNKIAQDEKTIISNLPNTFVNFRSVNDDFNPSISKYQCRAQFTYNKNLVRALWDNVIRGELTKNQMVMAITFEELKKNPRIDHLQFQLDAAMQVRGIAAQVEENAPQTTVFTVQPSKQRGFDIEIVKLGFPGG